MRNLLSIVFLIFVVSCASGVQKMRKLNPGMSIAEVEQIMEGRDSFRTVQKDGDSYTLYQYTNQHCNAHVSSDKCDFFVIFKNNKLIETGVRNVRTSMPPMQFINLFKN